MAIALPKQFAQIPRVSLLYPHASPIHALENLTAVLNPSQKVSVFAKREDHSSPLACAGNKYRKLEYIVPDILSPNPDTTGPPGTPDNSVNGGPTAPGKVTTVVTEGAVQSNHTVQVNAVANKLGLEYVGVTNRLTGQGYKEASDKDAFVTVGNPQMTRLLHSPSSTTPAQDNDDNNNNNTDPIKVLHDLHTHHNKVPYWIPSGASLHPLGGLGYARCAFEIAAQEEACQTQLQGRSTSTLQRGRFDYIFVACGSGSTVAGLIAGFKLVDRQLSTAHTRTPRKIIGILNSPTKPRAYHEERVLRFARNTGRLIGLDDPEAEITMADVHLDDRFVGTAYGSVDEETRRHLHLMAKVEGLVLDPVYTAKVAWGLASSIKNGELVGNGQVNALFIHTGGQAALPAYSDRI